MRKSPIGWAHPPTLLLMLAACRVASLDPGQAPPLARGGALDVRILLADTFGEGVQMAARDVVEAMARIAGVPVPDDAITTDPDRVVGRPTISVTVTSLLTETLGDQGYRIAVGRLGGGSPSLAILARSEIGAMYGLYQVAADLGVRYLHPEETFFPDDSDARLPWPSEAIDESPAFLRRGFHEHTQHPIPAADFLLNPAYPGAREAASRYLKWLARNRQNTLTFHLLKTVDLATWIPYIRDVVDEAHRYGIRVGVVVSFLDRQQNAWQLLEAHPPTASGHPDDSGGPADDAHRIRAGLDEVLDHVAPDTDCPACAPCPDVRSATGLVTGPPRRALFDFVGFQFGTSEFTTPEAPPETTPEDRAVAWLDTALDHLKSSYCQRDGLKNEYSADEAYPYAKVFAWVHIPCGVKASDGGHYFHLPLRANPEVGVFVHTTMFYDLDHPAPVYGCEDFHHQKDFLAQAAQQRRATIYFPETAWWLGFDNNVPLVLPITGRSREHDLREVLPSFTIPASDTSGPAHPPPPAWSISGHVAFTTGREWTYWQYDHFLTRATWDPEVTWDAYLDWIAPVYGGAGPAVAAALKTASDVQSRYFYGINPSLIFYLAGELPQDEVGAAAGVLARPPKVPFRRVLEMDDDALAAWKAADLDRLAAMRAEMEPILAGLPEVSKEWSDQTRRLAGEVRDALRLFVMRLDHALALYQAVVAARDWRVEKARASALSRGPDPSVRAAAVSEAEARLHEARAITSQVIEVVRTGEARYRNSVEQVARPRPDSLTAYKFGYLYETSTAYFWSRRDDQLASLIAEVFGEVPEVWQAAPEAVFVSDTATTEVLVPEDEAARTILRGFIPNMLWGVSGVPASPVLIVAQDYDASGLPDPGTEVQVPLSPDGMRFSGQCPEVPLIVRDLNGTAVATLSILAPRFEVEATLSPGIAPDIRGVTLDGDVSSEALIQVVVTVTAGGIDEEGVAAILKDFYGLDPALPLPDTLRFGARFRPIPLDTPGQSG